MKSIPVVLVLAIVSLNCFGKGGNTNTVQYAAASGDLARVKQFLAANPQLLKSKDGAGTLLAAAAHGQIEMMAFLVSQGADVNEKGFFDMTPLASLASEFKMQDEERFHKIAEAGAWLMDHGANVEAMDQYQKTPLLHAVECKQSELTRVLLEHGASQRGTYLGANSTMTPLHMAIRDDDAATVRELLKFNPPLDVKNREDDTPLVYAELLDRTEIVAMIQPLTNDTNVIPSRAEMRELGQRAANGDAHALDKLTQIGEFLWGLVPVNRNPYPHPPSPYMFLAQDRMLAASRELGKEVGKGNVVALQVLKKCLGLNRQLRGWAIGACSTAATAGSKDALNVLLAQDTQGQMNYQLIAPAEANIGPAVDYFIDWMNSDKPFKNGVGDVMTATNAVASAAAKGNEKAKAALDKFVARFGDN